jgi:hypothetical protein
MSDDVLDLDAPRHKSDPYPIHARDPVPARRIGRRRFQEIPGIDRLDDPAVHPGRAGWNADPYTRGPAAPPVCFAPRPGAR